MTRRRAAPSRRSIPAASRSRKVSSANGKRPAKPSISSARRNSTSVLKKFQPRCEPCRGSRGPSRILIPSFSSAPRKKKQLLFFLSSPEFSPSRFFCALRNSRASRALSKPSCARNLSRRRMELRRILRWKSEWDRPQPLKTAVKGIARSTAFIERRPVCPSALRALPAGFPPSRARAKSSSGKPIGLIAACFVRVDACSIESRPHRTHRRHRHLPDNRSHAGSIASPNMKGSDVDSGEIGKQGEQGGRAPSSTAKNAARLAASQFPAFLRRPAHLAYRHVYGHHRRGLACLPPYGFIAASRHRRVCRADTRLPARAHRGK